MIEEKEHPEDEPERKRKCDPLPVEVPKADEPGTAMRWLKCRAHRKGQRARSAKTTPVRGSGGCDEGERHAIVSTEMAYVPMEKRGAGKKLEEERGNKH
jgi:hypothetical protein